MAAPALLSKPEQGRPQDGRPYKLSISLRNRLNNIAARVFWLITLIPVGLVIAITVALAVRSAPILQSHSLVELFTGTVWKPFGGQFGFLPFIAGTFWVTTIGVILAVPPCLLTAFYLSEYARPITRNIMKPLLDVLAAIPSVVYGVWGMLVIVPFVQKTFMPWMSSHFGFIPLFASNQPTGFSVISGGVILAVMIIPFIIAIIYEILKTVPQDLREASLGLGATRWETITLVIFPKILPGIIAAIVLGASRALGETMAVLMVVGNVPQIPTSIFDAAYPLPALIANNYGEMMSIPQFDAALLLAAFILLLIILTFNVIATLVLQRILGRRGK
ncbi:MAG: phosphate ABC transporter permease subunit PstC [Anaerolineaceae bacterium]